MSTQSVDDVTNLNKQRVQKEALEILNVFQASLDTAVYSALQKALSNNLILVSYSNMDIAAWHRVTGFSVAAEAFYQYFATQRHVFDAKPKHIVNLNSVQSPQSNTFAPISTTSAATQQNDTASSICFRCGEHGTLISCDECCHSYHAKCIGLESAPTTNQLQWCCPSCTYKQIDFTQYKETISQCPACRAKFGRPRYMFYHIRQKHQVLEQALLDHEIFKQCSICHQSYHRTQQHHCNSKNMPSSQQQTSSRIVANMTRRSSTVSAKNSDDKTHKHHCKQCNIAYTARTSLTRHFRNNHPNQPYPPPVNDTDDDDEEEELDQEEQHDDGNEAQHECTRCDESFGTLYQLNKHYSDNHTTAIRQSPSLETTNSNSSKPRTKTTRLANGTDDRLFACNYANCEYSSAQRKRLFCHIRNVHNGKPWQCNQCASSFAYKQGLHKHHNEKHSFSNSNTMPPKKRQYIPATDVSQDNDNSNVGEEEVATPASRLFACTLCHKKFKTAQGIEGHMLTHHEQRAWKCPHCHRDFTLEIYWAQHIANVHGKKPYQCYQCGQLFTGKKQRTRHRNVDHSAAEVIPQRHEMRKCGECNAELLNMRQLVRHLAWCHGYSDEEGEVQPESEHIDGHESNTADIDAQHEQFEYNEEQDANHNHAYSFDHVEEENEEDKWCVCEQPASGDMVRCDNSFCEIVWYHWKCARVDSQPEDVWYCARCRKSPSKSNVLHSRFYRRQIDQLVANARTPQLAIDDRKMDEHLDEMMHELQAAADVNVNEEDGVLIETDGVERNVHRLECSVCCQPGDLGTMIMCNVCCQFHHAECIGFTEQASKQMTDYVCDACQCRVESDTSMTVTSSSSNTNANKPRRRRSLFGR